MGKQSLGSDKRQMCCNRAATFYLYLRKYITPALSMSSLTLLWNNDKDTFENKAVSQILAFAGDGKLKDGNTTSTEFREFLGQVPSVLLKQYCIDCLTTKFEEGGYALQDIVNQIGTRLGFSIEHGLYRGKSNDIGFDGIWISKEGHSIIVESKTTDTYRLNLDKIASYRTKLIEQKRVDQENSSILIVVGRDDTGDLEAQIRGSKHAWDMRLISTDSLTNLLSLKEALNDPKTIQQINELLKPKEYTRIDKLIELIFLTSKDLQIPDEAEPIESEAKQKVEKSDGPKFVPVNFRDECIKKIQKHLKIEFTKQSKVAFTNKDKSIGLICAISKVHDPGKNENYWFSLYPHQQDFLKEFAKAYVAYGCGSADNTILIPYSDFEPLVKNLWTTENEERMYYHVMINNRNKKFLLQQPKNESKPLFDVTKYLI